MSSSPVSRKRQKIHSSSPTSVNANVSLNTGRNYSQQQQNRRGRIISTVQRKRYAGIVCVVIIASLCALQHFRVKTLAPDENETELKDHHNHQAIGSISTPSIILNQWRRRHSSVKFIPYPHRTLGSGDSIQCQWETRPINNNSSPSHLDFTQRNAFTEGICIPPALSDSLHIFSSDEAIQCLSSKTQQRDIRVILAGDSYMKQMYIGLADILLSKHISEDKEMKDNVQRSKILAKAQYCVTNRRETNETFPFVQYLCEEECYGKKALDKCSQCINNNTRVGKDDVWVVGVGIHIYARSNKQVDFTVERIQHFLETEQDYKRTIYVSPPHFFHREDYPTQSKNMGRVYQGLLPNVAPEQPAHPFLDVYQLTKSCTWGNCTFDGGHRSRFVNRWKAQLLLNTLCEVQ